LKDSVINDCIVISLPIIHNRAGNITAINSSSDVPFEIKRIYYLYDVPGGEMRGGHAHKELHQLIVAGSGSFTVVLNDGKSEKEVILNRPYQGLLVVPGIWRELKDFSSGSICLVLASLLYDESDYIRSYSDFKLLKDTI
jgi:hypothetical protein